MTELALESITEENIAGESRQELLDLHRHLHRLAKLGKVECGGLESVHRLVAAEMAERGVEHNSPLECSSEKMPGLRLEPPHGFLLWKDRKTAVAMPPRFIEQHGEKVIGTPHVVISGDEAYGVATLGEPAEMALSEFDRVEWFERHRVYPEERRERWPSAATLFVYPVKKWMPYEKTKVVRNLQGAYIEGVEFKEQRPLTERERALIRQSERLPKRIVLTPNAVSLTGSLIYGRRTARDTDFVVVGAEWRPDEDQFIVPLTPTFKEKLDRVLAAVYQVDQDGIQYIGEGQGATFDHLPLYDLALVRRPRLEMEHVSEREPDFAALCYDKPEGEKADRGHGVLQEKIRKKDSGVEYLPAEPGSPATADKAKVDAPNYGKSEGERTCVNCHFNDIYLCRRFNFFWNSGHVCGDWKARTVDQKQANILLQYPDEGKTYRFVFQNHFRGKSAHGDFRVESGDYLVGWTVAHQQPGAIEEPVETLAAARRAAKNPGNWKMDLKTGLIKPREIRGGTTRRGNLRAFPKATEIPEDWLDVEGVTEEADPGEKPPVGATAQFPGVFDIVEKSTVEHGVKKTDFIELFIHGDKWGDQRWAFRLLKRGGEKEFAAAVAQAKGFQKANEVLPLGVEEEDGRAALFWVLMQPVDQTPHVLSKRAVEEGWLPPKGVSALPKAIRKNVPKALRYWEASGEEALERRAKLAELDIQELGGPELKAAARPFVLFRRTWAHTPVQAWDLFVKHDSKVWNFESPDDLLKGGPRRGVPLESTRTFEVTDTGGKDHDVFFLKVGQSLKVKGGTQFNPTGWMKCELDVLDVGRATLTESRADFRQYDFEGKEIKGLRNFGLADPTANVWMMHEPATGVKQVGGWRPYVLLRRTWRGQTVVRFGPSSEVYDLWIKRDGKSWHLVLAGSPLEDGQLAAYEDEEATTDIKLADGTGMDLFEVGVKVELAPGQPLNPTKDTPAFLEEVTNGEARTLAEELEFVKVEFRGGKMKGAWVFEREEAGGDLGEFRQSGRPETDIKGMKPLFGSPGGKTRIAKIIMGLIPTHRTYIEPFAGGASVFFAKLKETSEAEILNDLDSEIAFAYRFAKSLTPQKLARLKTRDWKGSVGVFTKLKVLKPKNDIERFYKHIYLSYWSTMRLKESFTPNNEYIYSEYPRSVSRWESYKERLKNVQVYNQDYWDIVQKCDSKNSFFYLDPPYKGLFPGKDFDFNENLFAERLKNIQGKFLLSYAKEKKNLFRDFHIRTISTTKHPVGRPIGQRKELLVSNYPLPKRIRRKSMETLGFIYECESCEKDFDSEVVLDESLCLDCKAVAGKQPEGLTRDLEGLHVLKPHGGRVKRKVKKAIVKAKKIPTGKPYYLLEEGEALGVVKLAKPEKIDLGEFAARSDLHKITNQERETWWPGKGSLWYYPVVSFEPLAKPVSVPIQYDLETVTVPKVEVQQAAPKPAPEAKPKVPPALPKKPLVKLPIAPLKLPAGPILPPEVVFKEGDKAGRRLRGEKLGLLREIKEAFNNMMQRLGELIGWAEYSDQEPPTFADYFKGDTGFALKEVGGQPWYFTWTTNAFEDRQKEIFSTAALEKYVSEAESKQERGFFNFWHIPGTDYARKEWQGVVGRFLAEAGPFLDDHRGHSAQKFFRQHPDGHPDIAPEGWGCSPEFRYLLEQRKTGVYDWVWITRTTTLPRAAAANIWTDAKEVNIMALEGKRKDAAVALFGEEFVEKLIEEGDKRTEALEDAGVAHKEADTETEADGEKADLGKFVEAIKDIAGKVKDEGAKKAILTAADGLTAGNAKERGQTLRMLSGRLEGDLKSRLKAIADALVAGEGYPEPGEEYPAPKAFDLTEEKMTELAETVAKQFAADLTPLADGMVGLAASMEAIGERVGKLEKSEAIKAETELPRYVLSLMRASEAKETALKEDDPLKSKKPAETQPKQDDGSMASVYFGSKK